jgi:MHS family proline/betaine transporter-like MFS transporter
MRKVVISGMLGNALEWYDFALYGHFVPIITQLFFPASDPIVALMAAFGIFAAGFLMRPLGAILFGAIGDRYGRRQALSLAILLMAIPTACIGLIPSYASIGLWAPFFLTVIRLLQGLSLGGEFSGSIAFMVEHSPLHQRGLIGSTAMISMNLGILAGTLVASLCSLSLSQEDFIAWGWRVPFYLGLFVGLIGLYIRRQLHESAEYQQLQKEMHSHPVSPLREVFSTYRSSLLAGIMIYMTVTVPFYTLTIFLKTYMVDFLHYDFQTALYFSTAALAVSTVVLPVSGYWSDRIGRRLSLCYAACATVVLTGPSFFLLNQGGWWAPLVGHVVLGALSGWYMGPVPAMLAELFPARARYTGIGLSYNISAALLGGTVPMVATQLIVQTGDLYAIAYYISFFGLMTLLYLVRYASHFRVQMVST